MAVIVYQGAPGFTGRVGAQGVNGSRVRSHHTSCPKLVNPLYCLFDIDQKLLSLMIKKKQFITIIEQRDMEVIRAIMNHTVTLFIFYPCLHLLAVCILCFKIHHVWKVSNNVKLSVQTVCRILSLCVICLLSLSGGHRTCWRCRSQRPTGMHFQGIICCRYLVFKEMFRHLD